jgi:hypothetical protein
MNIFAESDAIFLEKKVRIVCFMSRREYLGGKGHSFNYMFALINFTESFELIEYSSHITYTEIGHIRNSNLNQNMLLSLALSAKFQLVSPSSLKP